MKHKPNVEDVPAPVGRTKTKMRQCVREAIAAKCSTAAKRPALEVTPPMQALLAYVDVVYVVIAPWRLTGDWTPAPKDPRQTHQAKDQYAGRARANSLQSSMPQHFHQETCYHRLQCPTSRERLKTHGRVHDDAVDNNG